MEPYFARKLLPCFDEPSYKATWNVTIIHPKGTQALANNIEIGPPTEEGDFLITKFKTTPAMSSYLFAVFISDFTYVEGHTQSGIRFRVWTRPEASESAKYALEAGIKCIEGYEKLYGIGFPLKKQDMVALPDFGSGAMENWGLITYREALIIYDKKNYYFLNKIRVTTIVAHELSHQWFGNLVTMRWWDDLWLNEGSAAYVQSIGGDIIADGDFHLEEEFVSDQLHQSLELDATAASHPIIYPISRAEEIIEMFDPISYRKGASLLAMISKLMGKSHYNKNYLRKYAYKNADHKDLFRELDQQIPKESIGPNGKRLNVTDLALKYTLQMGYPYLTVSSINTTHDRVTQQRFKIDPCAKEREKFAHPPYGYKWDVPVWIQQGTNPEIILKWLPADKELVLKKTEEPLIVNADSHAIARMNYEPEGWERIFTQLETDHTVYSARTRYRMIADIFAMAAIEKVSYRLAFNVTKYLINEKEFLPWMALQDEIETISTYFGSLPQRNALNTFIQKLLEPRFYDINIRYATRSMGDNKGYMASRVDVNLWLMYCKADPQKCLPIINLYFKGALDACKSTNAILSKCGRVHPAIRQYVYNQVIRNEKENYKKLLQFYKRETLQLEKERILQALSNTGDPVLFTEVMSNITTNGGTILRDQDCINVALFLSKNNELGKMLLPHFIKHWDEFHSKFAENVSHLSRITGHFLSAVQTEADLKKLNDFIAVTPITARYHIFNQQIQKAKKKIEWLKKNAEDLEQFLPKVFS